MNFTEYRHLAERTLPNLGTASVYHGSGSTDFHVIDLNVLHVIMGMASEFGEICDATDKVNLGEEIADSAWYLANYANIRNIDITIRSCTYNDIYEPASKFSSRPSVYILMQKAISDLTDLEKKIFVYNKAINIDTLRDQAQRILDCLIVFCSEQGLDILDLFEKNINKLKVRYPNKFTVENAINRSLEEERKTLET